MVLMSRSSRRLRMATNGSLPPLTSFELKENERTTGCHRILNYQLDYFLNPANRYLRKVMRGFSKLKDMLVLLQYPSTFDLLSVHRSSKLSSLISECQLRAGVDQRL